MQPQYTASFPLITKSPAENSDTPSVNSGRPTAAAAL
jgi:hypothetical protein